MLAFTGKYGTGCLYLNNCVHGLENFLYLKLYNAMILVNTGIGDKYSTFRVRYCPCWHLLVNNNNNNNNIYLKSNIHKSSIDYKYIHMYNKIMLYT